MIYDSIVISDRCLFLFRISLINSQTFIHVGRVIYVEICEDCVDKYIPVYVRLAIPNFNI